MPGAAPLLKEIRDADPAGLYIISGSPEQMRKVLEAKLRLDGVRWDGFVLKPQLHSARVTKVYETLERPLVPVY